MDDQSCRDFFSRPEETHHRRYEALRAYFVEERSLAEVAEQFGYRLSAFKSMTCRFRAACRDDRVAPFFFPSRADGRRRNAAPATSTAPTHPPSPTSDA